MTCIIGLLDKEKDCVYIGADSLGSNYCSQALYKNRKVFKAKDNNNILMAISGDFKLQNILSIEENLIEEIKHLKNEVDFEHIVKYTSPKIMNLANKYYCITNDKGYWSIGGNIIFSYKNQLSEIAKDSPQILTDLDKKEANTKGLWTLLYKIERLQDKYEDPDIRGFNLFEYLQYKDIKDIDTQIYRDKYK